MIPLTYEQQEDVKAITHDLMLLSACSRDPAVMKLVCHVLGTLFGGVLLASEQETNQASEEAARQIKAEFELDNSNLRMH